MMKTGKLSAGRLTGTRLLALLALVVPATAVLSGCRGETSRQPPIHIVPNMDFQQKLKAQSESKFAGWTDGRGMRLPVRGTIPFDIHDPQRQLPLKELSQDEEVRKLYRYKNPDGSYVTGNPLPRTAEVLARGRERFEIHCAVCHGYSGRGDGIVGRKLTVHPPTFHAKGNPPRTNVKEAVFKYSDAEIFDVITTGKGTTMQPYRFQVSPSDRWAIIHYIRALQLRAKS